MGTVRFGFGSNTEVLFEFGLKDRKSAKFGSMSIKQIVNLTVFVREQRTLVQFEFIVVMHNSAEWFESIFKAPFYKFVGRNDTTIGRKLLLYSGRFSIYQR